MSGQHVGRVSDALAEDETLTVARSAQQRLKAALKPAGKTYQRRPGDDIGDGDLCPVEPGHGRMLTVRGSASQHCPHQTHDGIWAGGQRTGTTRSRWPLGHDSFVAAVKESQHA